MKSDWNYKKIGECCVIQKKTITPRSGVVYQCYSLPAFDNYQIPELLNGNDIKSNKLLIEENTILFNKLNPKFKRVWNIHDLSQKNNNICSSEFLPLKVIDGTDQDFLYYCLTSEAFTKKMDGIRTGTSSSQQRIDWRGFLNEMILFPDYYQQQKIALILKLLDNKIANNRMINDNLQQQAQALFESRFTNNLAFASMKLVALSDLCSVITKGTTPTTLGKSFAINGINFLKAESILDNHSLDKRKFAHIDAETNELLKRSIIQDGDIVFTIAGTLGRFAFIDNDVLPANTNQAVAIIRADRKKVLPEYLFACFLGNWHNDYYSKRVQQAVQANLSLATIKSLPIPVLEQADMNEYMAIITPIITLIKQTEQENERLSSLRDSLLPRLMSGEIDVSDVQI